MPAPATNINNKRKIFFGEKSFACGNGAVKGMETTPNKVEKLQLHKFYPKKHHNWHNLVHLNLLCRLL